MKIKTAGTKKIKTFKKSLFKLVISSFLIEISSGNILFNIRYETSKTKTIADAMDEKKDKIVNKIKTFLFDEPPRIYAFRKNKREQAINNALNAKGIAFQRELINVCEYIMNKEIKGSFLKKS
jgi:hypothetical protein